MPNINEAISTAIRVQAARIGKPLNEISAALSIGRTAFWNRLSNEKPWNTSDLEKIAGVLELADAWEVIRLAEQEAFNARAHAERKAEN